MRKTKIGRFLVMCVAVLAMLAACGSSGGGYTSNVDPAKAEKAFLSAVNKAYGTEFVNDESLRSKADIIWNKVDSSGKVRLTDIMYGDQDENGDTWFVYPFTDDDSLDDSAKFQLIEITEGLLKKYENPSDEMLAEIKQLPFGWTSVGEKVDAVCITAKKIGGRVCIVYVKDG